MHHSHRGLFDRRTTLALCAATAFSAFSGNAAAADLFGVRQDGHEVAAGDIKGWRLVYFGYTHCPDICPTSLQTMALGLEALGPIGQRITPVFVTVDPQRDTPEVMSEYVSFFSPRIVGLSPRPDQLAELVKEWRIKYERVDVKDKENYLIDHTASIFLVDPSGRVIGRYQHDLDGKTLANRIRASMLGD